MKKSSYKRTGICAAAVCGIIIAGGAFGFSTLLETDAYTIVSSSDIGKNSSDGSGSTTGNGTTTGKGSSGVSNDGSTRVIRYESQRSTAGPGSETESTAAENAAAKADTSAESVVTIDSHSTAGSESTAAAGTSEAADSSNAAAASAVGNVSESQAVLTGTATADTASAGSTAEAAGTVVKSTETGSSAGTAAADIITRNGYRNGDKIGLNSAWKYADFSAIHSGNAVMYTAASNRKDKIIAVNAGHGTKGGSSVKTYCHPDKTAKLTGGSTAAGAYMATAVSGGMTFNDGTAEASVTLRMAQILKNKLLNAGYDVLMIRDGEDVQLDNVARTVISNNAADVHIALHWDGDGLSTIKGVFYMSVPDGLKKMEPVASHWQQHEALGDALIAGLKAQGMKVWGSNPLDMDLTQTSYSTIPSVDIELGNQCSNHSDDMLSQEADGLLSGINSYFGY